MVLLNYALVGERGVSSIIIDELMTVAILKKEIKKDNPATITGDAKDLQLFLAKKQDEWLPETDALNTLLESEIDTSSYLHMRELWELRKPELFGPGVSLGKKVVHVLVVVPTEKRAASDPFPALVPAKKRRVNLRIAYAGPLHLDEFSVPMETIAAFNDIQAGFSMEGSRGRPLYFLYGPRQFGKSTIAYRIADWIAADPQMSDVECIFIELRTSDVRDAATFWTSLGMRIEPDSVCPDKTAFIKLATRGQRRFCLIVDEMDHLFDNKDLAKTFLSVLRTWKTAFYFCGFLGVGSHDLVYHYKVFRGDMKSSPFNVGIMIQVGPFSLEQMSAFFTLIASRYRFTESLRHAITDYSSGAPGVFGSMIRFTADNDKCTMERREWERWFKVDAFSKYLTAYNNTYCRIQGDLHDLNDVEWEAVKYVLAHDGKRMTASQVEGNCGIAIRGNHESRTVDLLLRMGVLIEGSDGALALVSEMMHRICVEALPVREIKQVASTDDPLELLCVALRFFNPQRISHQFASKRQSPSESIFHLELFATIRDIMQKASLTKGSHAEVKTPDSRPRADILLINGTRLAYEVKSNQLCIKEITAAARQADQYRQQFQVDHMVVVNFAPRGHIIEPIYQVKQFEDIQIIHAQFPNSCDEFDLSYLVNGQVQHRVVKAGNT